MRTRSLAVLFLLASLSANALEVASRDLFIPLAGRTPGANGTFWQTDLVLTNHSPEYASLRVHVDFYTGADREQFDVDVTAESSVVIEDFVRTQLHHDTALGTLRITSPTPDAQMARTPSSTTPAARSPSGRQCRRWPCRRCARARASAACWPAADIARTSASAIRTTTSSTSRSRRRTDTT